MEKREITDMENDQKKHIRVGQFRYSREAERIFLFYATIGMAILSVCLCLFGE